MNEHFDFCFWFDVLCFCVNVAIGVDWPSSISQCLVTILHHSTEFVRNQTRMIKLTFRGRTSCHWVDISGLFLISTHGINLFFFSVSSFVLLFFFFFLFFSFLNQHLIKLSNGCKVTHGPIPYNSVFVHFIEKKNNGNHPERYAWSYSACMWLLLCDCNLTNRRMNRSKEN